MNSSKTWLGRWGRRAAAGACWALVACAQGTVDEDEQAAPFIELSPEAPQPDEDGVAMAPALEHPITGDAPEPRLLDEDTACHLIVDTYALHGLELGCATTIRACPDLLRRAFGRACMLYHASTVYTCEDRILRAESCSDLYATSCGVEPAWGSEPLGCPNPVE